MRNVTFISCLVFILSLQAEPFEPASPQSLGLDPHRLARIDRLLGGAIDSQEIPGAVALIARHGKIGYHKSFGYADKENGQLLRDDSIFRIASMTKAVTSVGVMMLYEEGRFRLNDPISKFIPEFKNPKVLVEKTDSGEFVTEPAKREITIRDLLTHTSGITYPFIPTKVQQAYQNKGIIDGLTTEPLVLRDIMLKLAQAPLLHQPGEKWTYGLNTDLLGYLIEVISGESLDAFFRARIFEPLQMKDTWFYLPQELAPRLVTLYRAASEDGLVPAETVGDLGGAQSSYPVSGAGTYFSGGAGLSSTASDYARFLQMLLNDGTLEGAKVLSRKSVELMRAGHFADFGGPASTFGLGFSVVQNLGALGELGTEGTYAWGGAFYTSYWIDPKENLVAVLMSQVRPARTDVNERFRILVYQALD
jgi:CubicO group peptidase (beta-lactamase class C family)